MKDLLKIDSYTPITLPLLLCFSIGYNLLTLWELTKKFKLGGKQTSSKIPVIVGLTIVVFGATTIAVIQDPLIHSFARITMLGGIASVLIAETIPQLIFNILTLQKGTPRSEPLTLLNGVISIATIVFFILQSFTLTLAIPLLYILPLPRKSVKYLFHLLIQNACKFIVWINFTIKKEKIDQEKIDFTKPSVIVSNHQSHLDLVLILRLHPKIIVITNKWVWNNPIYGFIVRFAGYYPVYNGIDSDFNKIRKKVDKGYSILIFPEGSRTIDGTIKRYHQGAFRLAQDLKLEIQPLLIHGAYQCLPKTEFFMRTGKITQKFFEKINVRPINLENNETYRSQAKALTQQMREEFKLLSNKKENADFYKNRLKNQYIFKGTRLATFVKRKLHSENNFDFLNQLIPLKASIVDLGCNYGCLSVLLSYTSNKRHISGFDANPKNIQIATQTIKNNPHLHFYTKDLNQAEIPQADIYILNTELQQYAIETQKNLLQKCLSTLPINGMVIVRVSKTSQNKSIKKKGRFLSAINENAIFEAARVNGYSCKKIENALQTPIITYLIKNEE
jgi:1-acyl-sn-glycerol-3-phosphate acyltransferase